MEAQVLAHKPVSFASLTYSVTVLFSKLLKLWSWMQTQQTQNSFPGLKSYQTEQAPGNVDLGGYYPPLTSVGNTSLLDLNSSDHTQPQS